MHLLAFRYVQRTLTQHNLMEGDLCVEYGSYDVNGSIRPLFGGYEEYIGVDSRPGPGVDEVASAEDFSIAPRKADVIVSCEMFEHARQQAAIVANAARSLKKGGYFIITAANEKRTPHGNNGNLDFEPDDEHYAPLTRKKLSAWLAKHFSEHEIEEDPAAGDIYAWARL
jgi:SAM-dependent methyltransferase